MHGGFLALALTAAVSGAGGINVPVRGITISTHRGGQDWGSDRMPEALAAIRTLGANWVAIHPYSELLRRWSFGLAFWSAVALFFSTQNYFLLGGGDGAWIQALKRSLPQWYLWGVLTPFIIRADRFLGGGGVLLPIRVMRHVSFAFVTVYVVVRLRCGGCQGESRFCRLTGSASLGKGVVSEALSS